MEMLGKWDEGIGCGRDSVRSDWEALGEEGRMRGKERKKRWLLLVQEHLKGKNELEIEVCYGVQFHGTGKKRPTNNFLNK